MEHLELSYFAGGNVKQYSRLENSLAVSLQVSTWDFPGGPVVKSPSCNAGDVGLIPGQGTKISHAMGQLSPGATTTEPTRLN